MVFLDEKHVSFDEPLLVEVIEIDLENVELPADQKRARNRKLALWVLAALFIGLLLAAPSGRRTPSILPDDKKGQPNNTFLVRKCGHRMHRHAKHKYTHLVEPAELARHVRLDSNVKPSFPNVERTHHVDNHPLKRADSGPMCTTTQCTNYAQSIRANLAPNYTAIDPCEDFSTYVCGGWRQKNDYRADQACKLFSYPSTHIQTLTTKKRSTLEA
jgi:hypothetical protein